MRIHLKRSIDESYDIVFGSNLFSQIAEDLKGMGRCAIITDSNLDPSPLKEALGAEVFTLKAGEDSKNIDTCMRIINQMSKLKYGRDTMIIAFGGGVVGDIAGFISAIFNRGVPYVQVPTTLLAMADSAIGGKTGVDTEAGKNVIGAFKQPYRVYIDISTLQTLPDKEFRNGLAETIKHAVIQDAEFFKYLEENTDAILARNPEALLRITQNNCRIKGNVVEKDPLEKGLRQILNYGHTIGHAVEKLSGFSIAHGECVAIGMTAAARISNLLGFMPDSDVERQEKLLSRAGLPTKMPEIPDEDIIELTSIDKKARDGKARYVLPAKIGKIQEFDGKFTTQVDKETVRKALQ